MKIQKSLLNNSKLLRKSQTPHEDKLWYHLRAKRFQAYKFRRQKVIGKYIVDFYCHSRHLIIEIDGGQHNETIDQYKDRIRDENLKREGYIILRFWNHEIENNLEEVLNVIYNTFVTSLGPPSSI